MYNPRGTGRVEKKQEACCISGEKTGVLGLEELRKK